jgi:hypothetical protein
MLAVLALAFLAILIGVSAFLTKKLGKNLKDEPSEAVVVDKQEVGGERFLMTRKGPARSNARTAMARMRQRRDVDDENEDEECDGLRRSVVVSFR